MKILFFKPHYLYIPYIKSWEKENNIKVDILEEVINERNIEKIRDYDGLVLTVANKLDDNMYQKIADMGIKQISLTSVGYEQIDLDKASKAGLIVTNTPDYSPESIAEFTLMMILKALRHDKKIIERKDKLDYRQKEEILGETLMGKTLGIYGLGRIGSLVASYAHSLGAKVISSSRNKSKKTNNFVEILNSYDDVLKQSDIIVIYSALTDDNYHFFNKETFAKMKDEAILINSARGGLVDNKDLLEAINKGKIAFASLDVFEGEKNIVGKNNPSYDDKVLASLISHPNVEIYPHISYFTKTSMKNQAQYSLDSVVEVLKTGDSKNRVN